MWTPDSVMATSVTVVWLDAGQSEGKVDTISRKFVLDEGDLREGQEVSVQLTRKKGSRAKVWRAKVVGQAADKRAREPPLKKRKPAAEEKSHGTSTQVSRKKKKTADGRPPAHIRRSLEKLESDNFMFEVAPAPPPIVVHVDGKNNWTRGVFKRMTDARRGLVPTVTADEASEGGGGTPPT